MVLASRSMTTSRGAFTTAFTPFKVVDGAHPLSDVQIQQLRELLGGKGPAPSSGSVPTTRLRPLTGTPVIQTPGSGPAPFRDTTIDEEN